MFQLLYKYFMGIAAFKQYKRSWDDTSSVIDPSPNWVYINPWALMDVALIILSRLDLSNTESLVLAMNSLT